MKATKVSIARWLITTILDCYSIVNAPTPPFIRVYSTWAVAASWAKRRGATLQQICQAATWSSPLTFACHYCLDVSPGELFFGRKILKAVIPP
ncbi:hypothetical protein GDO81_023435 [Engystomops pustulosus]|uniref:Secreted protein n=1 Tax=Engystomops pustulosus TaxID=76066 RepID=A0AAV6YVM4_ENGPU|nr:hypothetical protein GDO81_023435 [Engystomops pustulosus]